MPRHPVSQLSPLTQCFFKSKLPRQPQGFPPHHEQCSWFLMRMLRAPFSDSGSCRPSPTALAVSITKSKWIALFAFNASCSNTKAAECGGQTHVLTLVLTFMPQILLCGRPRRL